MIVYFAIIPILLAYKIPRLKLDRQSEILAWISFGLSELIYILLLMNRWFKMLLIFIYGIILIWCIIGISMFGDRMNFASFVIIVAIMLFSVFMIISTIKTGGLIWLWKILKRIYGFMDSYYWS